MPYLKVRATTEYDALRIAKRTCTCKRSSFAGVQWYDKEKGVWHQIPWRVVDLAKR